MKYKDVSNQILSAAEADQKIRFRVHNTKDLNSLRKEIVAEDTKNTAMMKEIVGSIGWPTISKVGPKASHAAWLLVQHADKYVDFQKVCLAMMKNEDLGEVLLADIAFLTDRIRMSDNLPQIYGTQFRPTKTGQPAYEPYTIEDIKTVNTRRKSMGLNTLEENRAEINQLKPEGTKQSSLH